MSNHMLLGLLIVSCLLTPVALASDETDIKTNTSCGANAAYLYLHATGRPVELTDLLTKEQFRNSSQSVEEIIKGLEVYGVLVAPVKISRSQLSNLNGYSIVYLTKNKDQMGHFTLCHFGDGQVRVFEPDAPTTRFDPAQWDKAGLTTVVLLEKSKRPWKVWAYAMVGMLSVCLASKSLPYLRKRRQVAFVLVGMTMLFCGCTDKTKIVSSVPIPAPVSSQAAEQAPMSDAAGFINADKVVEQIGEIVVTYPASGEAKAEVTFRNISGATLQRSNFESNAPCCSPALLANIEPEVVPDQEVFKAHFDIRTIMPGENKLPMTMVVKTDQFLSQWGNDADVVGDTSTARLSGPVILTATKSVQGDLKSAVSGELIVILPTDASFDADLIQIHGLPRLESLKVNSDNIVTRKDRFYTAYAMPYSGNLSLDDSLVGVEVLTGELSYGDTRCDVRLVVSHSPEWTLSGGRTEANCVIINNMVFPKAIEVENNRNHSFTIEKAELAGASVLDVSIRENRVEFAAKDIEDCTTEQFDSTLLLDIRQDGAGETSRLELPMKIHRRLAEGTK